MSHRALAILSVGCLAGSSSAAVFSFPADNDHSLWTFTGGSGRLTNARDAGNPVILLIDDVDGPLPPIPFATQFIADFAISYVESASSIEGLYTHTYAVNGTFSFLDLLGNTMLTATVANGVLSTTGDELSWYAAGTIEAGPRFETGSVVYEWFPPPILGYGLRTGTYEASDVEFSLVSMNMAGTDVALDRETHLPMRNWSSEASFHGQNDTIPAPGGAVIAGLCGLLALRRRR